MKKIVSPNVMISFNEILVNKDCKNWSSSNHNQKMILILVFKGVNIGIRNFTGFYDIVSIVKRMG